MRSRWLQLDEDLDRRLRETAAAEGRSASAVIRDALGAYLHSPAATPEDPFRELIGAFTGHRSDASVRHDDYLYGEHDAIG